MDLQAEQGIGADLVHGVAPHVLGDHLAGIELHVLAGRVEDARQHGPGAASGEGFIDLLLGLRVEHVLWVEGSGRTRTGMARRTLEMRSHGTGRLSKQPPRRPLRQGITLLQRLTISTWSQI